VSRFVVWFSSSVLLFPLYYLFLCGVRLLSFSFCFPFSITWSPFFDQHCSPSSLSRHSTSVYFERSAVLMLVWIVSTSFIVVCFVVQVYFENQTIIQIWYELLQLVASGSKMSQLIAVNGFLLFFISVRKLGCCGLLVCWFGISHCTR
jgi:hypothetical protein